jgi:hypothetical protein
MLVNFALVSGMELGEGQGKAESRIRRAFSSIAPSPCQRKKKGRLHQQPALDFTFPASAQHKPCKFCHLSMLLYPQAMRKIVDPQTQSFTPVVEDESGKSARLRR